MSARFLGGGMTARRAASRGESCRPGTEVARAEPRHGCPRLFVSLSRLPPTIRAGKVVSTLLHHRRRPHRSAIPYLAKHVSATTLLSGHEAWPLIRETLFVRRLELCHLRNVSMLILWKLQWDSEAATLTRPCCFTE